ncbi:MAG TPA: hypothetical protein VKV39_14580 [Candidatus Sulfotelmatobacter sp.]|nr:hypothetical protein [Candidatus Sulfotelmatobacter sp.]
MDDWRPATIEEVNEIVARELKACDAEQLAAFDKYGVEPFSAPIVRYGQTESVAVVARNGDQVIYYEEVEAGFNVSQISHDGRVLEHWCNQDELRFALNAWIEGRSLWGRFGPAAPVK